MRELRVDVEMWLNRYLLVGVGQLDMTAMVSSGMDLLHRHKLVLPADLALLFRVLLRLQGLGRGVGMEVRVTELLQPYVSRMMADHFEPPAHRPQRQPGRRSWEHLVSGLPEDIQAVLEQLRTGNLGVDFRVRDPDHAVDHLVDGGRDRGLGAGRRPADLPPRRPAGGRPLDPRAHRCRCRHRHLAAAGRRPRNERDRGSPAPGASARRVGGDAVAGVVERPTAKRLTTTALRGCNFEVGIEREVVGREVELDRLYRLIAGAVEHGGALLVIGDPGIGKSTLLRAAADHAGAAGFLVLGTTGVESEATLPYAGLYELLRPVLDGLDALPPAQRDALSKAFGIVVGSTPEPFLVALATLNLLAELATTRPLYVGVDDVQWLDGPTQAALAFVARRVSGDPIVVVGTTRRGFSGPFHTAGLEELDVVELSESAAREVLETTGVGLSRTDLDEILGAALGNPLALVELPNAWLASDASVSADGASAHCSPGAGVRGSPVRARAGNT